MDRLSTSLVIITLCAVEFKKKTRGAVHVDCDSHAMMPDKSNGDGNRIMATGIGLSAVIAYAVGSRGSESIVTGLTGRYLQ
jgi:hypothetical protein